MTNLPDYFEVNSEVLMHDAVPQSEASRMSFNKRPEGRLDIDKVGFDGLPIMGFDGSFGNDIRRQADFFLDFLRQGHKIEAYGWINRNQDIHITRFRLITAGIRTKQGYFRYFELHLEFFFAFCQRSHDFFTCFHQNDYGKKS